ncbi:hypothetical protein IEQ34_018116 [Dendrobium chrysotoxum]|uniref:Uncharacterized protein n=1 Tax=Dendrobium chrysotoxum TaxID=161865 RepID=A0AAV7GCE9_DENCH|nr:hypothetical protein IEQ34_018116 [Dendrobium chrysotoxum]
MITPIQATDLKNQLHSVSLSMPDTPEARNPDQPMSFQAEISAMRTYQHEFPSRRRVIDNCYDSFKTNSLRFENQFSRKSQEIQDISGSEAAEQGELPTAERYFAALEGPELEELKAKTLILPQDEKWPFLLRFTISSFGVSVGIGIQAFLWKIIATSPSMSFLHVGSVVYYVLWCIAVFLMILVASTYVLKMIFYFEAVKREFLHPIRVNFFFTPWIGCILLVVSAPPSVAKHLHSALWYVLMAPILCLELKIYGQWMMGGERRLSKVANPSTHLSIAGNFTVALLGSSMGLKEGPVFFFAVGLAHYLVLFVTLYQRLPTNETLPKDLHPVFFLFVAVPSLASVSWSKIVGHFDLGSRIAYFTSMFIYASLVVRVNFFRGFRFSLAWWAYIVPMASASIATIIYTGEVDNLFMKILSVALSFISALTCLALVICTIFHAFVLHDLFPNDIAIAIKLKKSS